MTIPDAPPPGLRWANTDAARAIATLISIAALVLSVFLLWRLQNYTDCIAVAQQRDGERTRAIAAATDDERAADAALIAGPTPGGPDAAELRRADVAARAVTDRVREANPPPAPARC